jgi:hypothetical protein
MEKWQLENEENIQKIKNIIEFFKENAYIINTNIVNTLYFDIEINKKTYMTFGFEDYNFLDYTGSYYYLKFNFEDNINLDEAYIVIDFLYRSTIFENINYINYKQKKLVKFLGKSYDEDTKMFVSNKIDIEKIKSELEKYRTLKQLENF